MTQKKTPEQVQEEISALRDLLPSLSPAARPNIQAALRVLTEELSHNDVYDLYEDDEDVLDDALATRMWRDGDTSKPPLSVQWREIL